MDKNLELLARDKYAGDASLVTQTDVERLAGGEPLAYVIGWIPFLGLQIRLESRPLIPRPETEWWTDKLITRLQERFGDAPFSFLDLCAGSGAIGLTVLREFPNASASFIELMPEHCEQIKENISVNNLDASRVQIICSDLFTTNETWDVIATNPPYIPDGRALDASVTSFEPSEALFSGDDGLCLIRSIAAEVPQHLNPQGEMWLEADVSNIEEAQNLLQEGGARESTILTDQYDRPRVVVSYYT